MPDEPQASREMTLAEWVCTLPTQHFARRQFVGLLAAIDMVCSYDISDCDDDYREATETLRATAEKARHSAEESVDAD